MRKSKIKKMVGFSTGTLYPNIQPLSDEAIELCKLNQTGAIEIACLRNSQIPLLWGLNLVPLKSFAHVSIHMPTDIKYVNDAKSERSVELLKEFCKQHNKIFRCAVFHSDTILDWNILLNFSKITTVAIENMDNRKSNFRNMKDIQKILSRYPEIKLVFDINHWISNGNTIKSAYNFIETFKNHIIEVHISGYWHYHEPILKTLQFELIEVIAKLPPTIPVIIESVIKPQEIKKEYNLIKNLL